MVSVGCILLAAGASSRMGEPKLLKMAGGKTIFEMALGRHLESSLDRVVAVVPGWIAGFGPVMGRCSSGKVSFVVMDEPCEMSSSLKAGWKHLRGQGELDGIMISLADQPLVTAGTIDRLIRSFSGSYKPICVPVFEGRRGRPVVISAGLGDEVLTLEGDEGARRLLLRHDGDIEEVEVLSDEVHLDLDRPEDLEELAARLDAYDAGSGDTRSGDAGPREV